MSKDAAADDDHDNSGGEHCGGGTFFPLFPSELVWHRGWRLWVYGLGLGYCFLGIAIISDIFMAAIEVITSKEKTIVVMERQIGGGLFFGFLF